MLTRSSGILLHISSLPSPYGIRFHVFLQYEFWKQWQSDTLFQILFR